jgi:hypothetical protein
MSITASASPVTAEEQAVVADPESFMAVRHLAIRGGNFDIGRTIGQTAVDRYGDTVQAHATDPVHARARRRYFQRHYPIHWMRTQGVAAAFGVDPEDDRYDMTGLMYRIDLPPGLMGCSVAYFPPVSTSTGSGFLSRNYDFSVGSIADVFGIPVPPEVKARLRPLMGEPYIMEWYPSDGGYASIAIQNFDLLSGTMDGINSAGLVVSILADDEAIMLLGPRLEPHPGAPRAVGVHELQLMRLVLDTCATAEEAEDVMLGAKEYYSFAPLHYMVADRAGHSFIYENSTGRNRQYVFEGGAAPLLLTNFELYRHAAGGPEFNAQLTPQTNAFWRYRKMQEMVGAHADGFAPADFEAISEAVRAPELFAQAVPDTGSGPAIAANPMVRTLWHSVYNQVERSVDVSFYLGDAPSGNGHPSARRSGYMKFALAS